MRKALFATVVAGGIAPFLAVGCSSNNGSPLANNNTSSDWFGVGKLASLFKSDEGQISTTEVGNPHDPTSLAYKGNPLGADMFVATARLNEKQNNVVAAEEYYKRALAVSENDLAALVGYAHLLDRQGKLDEATNLYQQAAQHHPQDATAHNDLGLCYARRGMLNESVVELSKAVELQPQKQLYRNNLAMVFVELGQPQRSLEHLMVGEQPAVAHYNLACLLHQRGHSQSAAAHFAQAAHFDPSLPGAQELAQQLGETPAGARIANVRPVQQASPAPQLQGPRVATAQAGDMPGGQQARGMPDGGQRWPQTGGDRNWAAYDVSSPSANATSGGAATGFPGAPSAAIPPTPETASTYALPASAVDMLPPVEQPAPRY
ncbi:MAG: tetratricopeptide repeat protein [Pirellulales bacterium]